jgi:DNA-binding transcriptional MerR regulator
MYTTSTLAELVGVHPNTLKLWEDQGIIPEPKRDSVNRRIYSDEEVERIKRIAAERRQAYLKQQARL